jgi:hypothetical protein
MKILYQVLWVCLAIPVAILLMYALIRIASLACLHSWWDTKLWYTKKILGSIKEDPPKGEEGKNGTT